MATEFPTDGMAVTVLRVVADLDRAVQFYRDVLGASLYREYGGSSAVFSFAGATRELGLEPEEIPLCGGGPAPTPNPLPDPPGGGETPGPPFPPPGARPRRWKACSGRSASIK